MSDVKAWIGQVGCSSRNTRWCGILMLQSYDLSWKDFFHWDTLILQFVKIMETKDKLFHDLNRLFFSLRDKCVGNKSVEFCDISTSHNLKLLERLTQFLSAPGALAEVRDSVWMFGNSTATTRLRRYRLVLDGTCFCTLSCDSNSL